MKRIVGCLYHDGRLGIEEETMPKLAENEVLVEVHASLISPGTEMSSARNLRRKPDPAISAPIKFGYSNAGIVIKTKGDARGLVPGMRVACMGAGAALHANYAAVPVNLVVPIPDGVTFEQAAYLSLAATALQAVRRTDVRLGEYGSVLGMGIVGNLAAQLYRLSGARVLGWETLKLRARLAKKCGVGTVDFLKSDPVEPTKTFAAPWGLDFALFAFGGDAEKAFLNIKKCMKISADGHAMGRVVLVGGCRVPVDGGAASGNLDIRASSRTGAGYHDHAWEYGRDYPAAFVQFTTQRNAQELIRLISEKRLAVDPLTTHRMPLENIAEAGDLLVEHPDRALGVILTMKH
ncbi:MAG: hypothetical protein IJS01_00650 [Lentisphaeria bacterium]|nr:hypothetical protein [Lentisphaeria bacterium]